MRSQYWCKVALHPDEMVQGPDEIIRQLQQKEEENVRLLNELEGKKVYCGSSLIYSAAGEHRPNNREIQALVYLTEKAPELYMA